MAKVPTPGSDYTVQSGDNLSEIAQRAYGDAEDWDTIYNANKSVIGNNPNLIKPGQILSIPLRSDPEGPIPSVPPFVKPGEPLGYVDRLKGQNNWPPKRRQIDGNTVTPFLVVPAFPGDVGTRPLPANQAFFNGNVEVVDENGNVVIAPTVGSTYTLRCRAFNFGAAAAYGGIAEFYIGNAADFDARAASPGTTMPIFGLAGFVVTPGIPAIITCPNKWTPASMTEAQSTVVVEVYDAFIDRLTNTFDAIKDRHVARRDFTPDFSGTWSGVEILDVGGPSTQFSITMVITQSKFDVKISISAPQVGTVLSPPQPVSATISNGQVQLTVQEFGGIFNAGNPTNDFYVLTLPDPATLHFTHHKSSLVQPQQDQDFHSDLKRT
jgi:hypothetical protein